jgi:predicted transcriptional regulator
MTTALEAPAATNELVKISFTLPDDTLRKIQEVAEKERVTVTHVLRRALKTELFLNAQEAAGKKILIDDGNSFQRLVRM